MKKVMLSLALMTTFLNTSVYAADFTSKDIGVVTLTFDNIKKTGLMTLDVPTRKLNGKSNEIVLKVVDISNHLVLGRLITDKVIDHANTEKMEELVEKTKVELNSILDDGVKTASNGEALLSIDTVDVTSVGCSSRKQKKIFKEATDVTTCNITFERRAIYNLN